MRVTLTNGYQAVIAEAGTRLEVFAPDGKMLFAVTPPEHSGFYQFARHAVHGECLIVSFEPKHKINGWMDWYYRIDVEERRIERLNPWR